VAEAGERTGVPPTVSVLTHARPGGPRFGIGRGPVTTIKICGITNWNDARLAVDVGADLLGFIFAPSPRHIAPETARDILRGLPKSVETVGVVRDLAPEDIVALRDAVGFGWVQLHGSETPETARRFHPRVIKAFSIYRQGVGTFKPFAGAVLLLDQPKRTARRPETPRPGARPVARPMSGRPTEAFLRLARRARHYGKVLLAGGLDPENVGEWVRRLRPWGVDVARGVEAHPGRKDPARVRAFVDAVRRARGDGDA
jgi:phosphoribosylanthranilate isomerase